MNYCTVAIDLSAQALVSCDQPEADMTYLSAMEKYVVPAFGVYFNRTQPTSMQELDTSFENLDLAPEEGYGGGTRAEMGKTYVIKSGDPIYAKLRVISISEGGFNIDVEYVVQTDGTRILGPALAVEPATWGKIKALYR